MRNDTPLAATLSPANVFEQRSWLGVRGPHVLFYSALVAANIALIWLLPYFPSQDGTTHIYNVVILRDLLHHQGNWQAFYAPHLELRPVPNLGFHLVAYPLLSILRPLAVERVFCSLYILLLGLSVPAFLKGFDQPVFPVSYFAFVAIFNRLFLLGFYNNVVGVPLFLFALAVVWKLRRKSWGLRAIVLNLLGLALFVVHLVPFVIFVLAASAMAATEADSWRERFRDLARLLLVAIPLFVLMGLYAGTQVHHFGFSLGTVTVQPKITGSGTALPAPPSSSHHLGFLGVYPRLLDVASFSGLSFSVWHTLPGLGALLLLLIGLGQALIRPAPATASQDDFAWKSRFLGLLCAGLVILCLFAPGWVLGSGFLNLRLPVVILLLGLPLLSPDGRWLSGRSYGRLLALLAVATLLLNAAMLWQESEKVAEFVRGVQAPIPPGSTVLTADFEPHRMIGGYRLVPDPLIHASAYYGLHGAVDLNNFEATLPYFLTRALHPLPEDLLTEAYLNPRAVDWKSLPQVQYLLCWKLGDDDSLLLSPQFDLFWKDSATPLTIWKRR